MAVALFPRVRLGRAPSLRTRWFLGSGAFAFVLAASQAGWAQCREQPAVFLDERTAATHLLAKVDPELPATASPLDITAAVVLRVTVDRRGRICALTPVSGPPDLHRPALDTVKKHWRYRPFRLNWKPVVAQFPVTVRFNPPKRGPRPKSA